MAITFLYPAAVSGDNANWTLTGAATKPEAVDDPAGAPDDDTSYIECTSTAGAEEPITFTFSQMPDAVAVTSVTIHFRSRLTAGSGTHHCLMNGTAGTNQVLTGSYADKSDVFTTDPLTSGAWSVIGVNAIVAGVNQINTSMTARCTQIYLEVDFVPSAAKIGAARDVGSRLLRMFRRAVETVAIEGPLTWADSELYTDVAFTHAGYPDPAEGSGAGYKVWQRALLRLYSSSINLDTLQVAVGAFDLRPYLVRFWDTAIAKEPAAGTAPGAARLDPGVERLFSRGSGAWVQNAAVAAQGSIQLMPVSADVEKNETDGLLIEEARQNDIYYSAFGSGVAVGWTATNVTDDTADLLFVETVTGQSAHFARPGVSNCRLVQTTQSYAGSEQLTLSMWHKDDDAQPLGWTLTRSTDGFYFNNATPGFQVGAVTNVWTVRATPLRDQSNVITLSAAAQTLTLTIYAETASGQDNHLYHVQLEEGRFATSAIITGSSAIARVADVLKMDNQVQCWWPEQLTAGVTFVPEFSTDASGGDHMLFQTISDDSGSWEQVYYRNSTGLFRYERRVGGVTYVATKAATLTRGTAVRVVARATGINEELGVEPFTLSIFVDGVKGTDDVADDVGPESDFLWIGTDSGIAAWADGNLRHMTVTPLVLTDEEIPDWL